MHVLTSGWLQRMVDKAGNTPQARIIALFDILQDWMEAPGLRQSMQEEALTGADQHELKAYLLQLSMQAGVADAEALSNQLLFMLLGAVQRELRTPGCAAFEQAGQVARLLLAGQRNQRKSAVRAVVPAMAAMLVAVLLAPLLVPTMIGMQESTPVVSKPDSVAVPHARLERVNPDRLAALYQMHNVIHSGQCWYPQALMLPPEQRAIFLENVVSGDDGDISPRNLELVTQLYQKVECYYPPAALV